MANEEYESDSYETYDKTDGVDMNVEENTR